jgi:caffeoyl-CoA O-methyltransferase
MAFIPQPIEDYCISHSTRPSELARELQNYTQKSVHGSNMLIGEMEASVLTSLIHLGQVKNILELGTYTGYSALVMAEQLPSSGRLVTIDINKDTTAVAQSFWARSPHGEKITHILKPALEALEDIHEKFDLIFIDADKNNYSNYLNWSLNHLSNSGIIVVDNTLWAGKVLTPGLDKQTDSIIAHNQLAKSLDGHVKTLLPIRDGMFLIQKRKPRVSNGEGPGL